AFAVVVSLGFVAFEMKLSRDFAKAEMYQQRIAMEMGAKVSTLDVDAWREGTKKVRLNEQRTRAEKWALIGRADISMLQAENVHYQYQLGLMDENDWSVWQYNMVWMLNTPCYRQFFERERNAFRKNFVTEVERIYSNLTEIDCPPTSDEQPL
ncbi:MAG: hypothetical protein ABJ084_15370, partial [Halioglobus sp.]